MPTTPAERLARLLGQLEERVTDIEQGRPPDAPERRIENIDEAVESDDTVSETQINDPVLRYNDGDNYNQSEYP